MLPSERFLKHRKTGKKHNIRIKPLTRSEEMDLSMSLGSLYNLYQQHEKIDELKNLGKCINEKQ